MSQPPRTDDPLWPRASNWPCPLSSHSGGPADIALLGVPAFRSSITPTGAHATPSAVREALQRYSTYSAGHDVDVADLTAIDLGDVEEPDGTDGELRVASALKDAAEKYRLIIAVGGDNSITYSVMHGLWEADLGGCGLVTVDAHHDVRDGVSNGSPVRRLIEAGLPADHIVQIGIADFSNSAEYATRARELGITVVPRSELRHTRLADIVTTALDIAGRGGRPVYVDLDVDVCDRAAVPGCPAAAPGGISADELRQLAYLFASDPRVRAIDITEVDATVDANDGRTVRLAALLVLESAAGLALREEPPDGRGASRAL